MKTYFKKDMKKKRKKKRETDEEYLSFIESQPCLITGRTPCDAHHEPILKSSGMGTKGPDRETVPLIRMYHTDRHNTGKETFWEKYQIDYIKEIKRLQSLFDKLE